MWGAPRPPLQLHITYGWVVVVVVVEGGVGGIVSQKSTLLGVTQYSISDLETFLLTADPLHTPPSEKLRIHFFVSILLLPITSD